MGTATVDHTTGPASVGRRERRVAATRQAITAAARDLFDAQGYAETTLDQIAERADVAPRTLFRYFESKEALLFAGYGEFRRSLVQALAARPADESPVRSVVLGLSAMTGLCEAMRPEFVRAQKLADDDEAVGAYERVVLRSASTDTVAQFIAVRLDVDIDADPRPRAWAAMLVTAFGVAMKDCVARGVPFAATAMFADLLGDTAAVLQAVAADLGD